jgi:HipA-like protein
MSLFKWFYKLLDEDQPVELTTVDHEGVFTLSIEDLVIGTLSLKDNQWFFQYSDEFKQQDRFRRLVGFSDLDKTYTSDALWPFFRLRIPGLKQPLVKEILKSEKIDINDEFSLLKRFGKKNISNPYILNPA